MTGLKKYIIDWVEAMISDFDSNVSGVLDVLSKDIFSGSLYNTAVSVSNVIKPIALTIITVVFLIEFIRVTVNADILKWEYALKVIYKFIFAKVAIDLSFYLMSAIYATSAEWVVGIGNIPNSGLGHATKQAMKIAMEDYSWQQSLGLVITMALPLLCVWVIGMIINVIAYARMIELLILISVSPLPCALLPLEGTRIAQKFFLRFAAASLHGVFIVIALKIYTSIVADVLIGQITNSKSFTGIAYSLLLGSLVLGMAVIKSGSWANSLMDAA